MLYTGYNLLAGGQEELGGAIHSERMMADFMKILAHLTMQNQQLLQQDLQQRQQQAIAGYSSRWRPEKRAE